MSIFVLAPNENWICDRFVKEWNAFMPYPTTQNIQECSILWLLADWCWNQVPREILSSKKVVATVHHITPEKFGDREKNEFIYRDQYVNFYHVPCLKTKEQIENLTKKPIWIQPFWVNDKIWYSAGLKKREHMRNQMSLDDSHFLVGSFQRDTEGHDLISPKLEKGPDLFCDAIEQMRDAYASHGKEVRVLLAGWRRQYVMKRLQDANIKFYYAELPPFETVNMFYNSLDLYVVSARCEGGPQSIVECAAAKTPIVSTDVGLASVFLPTESIFVPGKILEAKPNVNYAYEKVKDYFMPAGFQPFVDAFSRM
jgi:glycosyltransferase involved in cell wall biosynthesis